MHSGSPTLTVDWAKQIQQRYAARAVQEWERLLPLLEADPRRWAVWKALLLKTCNEPSIVGISNHLLVIARKPEAEGRGGLR